MIGYLALGLLPEYPSLVAETGDSPFVEVHHVHDALDLADHFRGAHIGQRLRKKFPPGFGAALFCDLPVPLSNPKIFREELSQ